MITKIKREILRLITRESRVGIATLTLYRILYPPVSFYKYIKSEVLSWLVAGRKYKSRIRPTDLIYIDPQAVNKSLSSEIGAYPKMVSEVNSEDWSSYTKPISESSTYKSFEKRYVHNTDWKDTRFFERVSNSIADGEIKWGCTSISEFRERCNQLDKLYESISKEGYKTQRELLSDQNDPIKKRKQRFGPELQEVLVCIDKNGETYFYDGRHRFYMAKIIGLEKIPVRVKMRHKKWQSVRDRVSQGECPEPELKDHPDLQF